MLRIKLALYDRMQFHFVARTNDFLTPFNDREHCAHFWNRLRRRFDRVLAFTLMPEHLHLLIEGPRERSIRWEVAIELRAFTRRYHPGRNLWETVPRAREISDSQHLLRQIRYVHLNPCRRGLKRDPLEWEWSTHRDICGLVSPSWIDTRTIARAARKTHGDLPGWFHQYVSADATVDPKGTPAPRAPMGHLICTSESMVGAALAATRQPLGALRSGGIARSTLLALARHSEVSSLEPLARELGVSRATIYRWTKENPADGVESALKCAIQILSDPRLLPTRSQLRK